MTGCKGCDAIQERTGVSTVMCPRCTYDMSVHEYLIAKKRIKVFALAKAQEENNYIEEIET